MEAIAILIPGKLTGAVIDALVLVAPLCQASVNVVLIGVDEGASFNSGFDDGLNPGSYLF